MTVEDDEIDGLGAEIDEMVGAGLLASDGGDPPKFSLTGVGETFLVLARECARATGVSENVCFNLLTIGNLRRLDYERAVANRLYVRAPSGDGFACGCPREHPHSAVHNMVCRNGDCLNYGAHVRAVPGERCQWCGKPFTWLAVDPLRGAR